MATTFQLTDGTNTIDLTAATGLRIQDRYVPKVASPTGDGAIPPYVTEVIPVILFNTTVDLMAADLQKFHLLQRTAAEYWLDPSAVTPVILQCGVNNETSSRGALVKSLAIEFTPSGFPQSLYDLEVLDGVMAQIIVVRHPYWESSARKFPNSSPAAGIVTAYDYTAAGTGIGPADVAGDVGARVDYFVVTTAAGDELGRLWLGLRSAERHGTLGNFISIWECEDGTNNAAETGVIDAVHGGGSGGNIVQLTEADLEWDATWQRVMAITLADVTANYVDNFGDFLWLLRAAQGGATTWDVQFRYGYSAMDDADFIKGEVVEVSNSSFDFHEMGQQIVPIRNLEAITLTGAGANIDGTFAIQIWARRTSGVSTLLLDCLVPIPVDIGHFTLSEFTTGATGTTWLGSSPKDIFDSWADDTPGGWSDKPKQTHSSFQLPIGDGRMIICWARETISDLSDQIALNSGDTGGMIWRWLSLRGAE